MKITKNKTKKKLKYNNIIQNLLIKNITRHLFKLIKIRPSFNKQIPSYQKDYYPMYN
ncbi:MAG: hypothetical protein Q4E36_03585 [Bacillota bacterium]|nr:hypothetical protein [Bacillota bacterium]